MNLLLPIYISPILRLLILVAAQVDGVVEQLSGGGEWAKYTFTGENS